MSEDNLPLSSDRIDLQTGALVPAGAAEHGIGEWNGATIPAAPTERTGPDFTVYLHALRRHWLMALGIGLSCAGIIGPTIWWALGTQYTAESSLRVAMQEDWLLPGAGQNVVDRERFEVFKSYQENLIKSRLLLTRALAKPEVARIPVIREETSDPVEWLAKRLQVSFPGRSEYMVVKLTREDPVEAKDIVAAVVESYWNEVVVAETDKKRQRLSEVEKLCDAKRQEMQREARSVDAAGQERRLVAGGHAECPAEDGSGADSALSRRVCEGAV